MRLMTYGPLVPMDQPTFWQRLLGAR
jgi:hypothetical protein